MAWTYPLTLLYDGQCPVCALEIGNLRAAYCAVGLGWIAAPSGWPLLRPLFDAGYRVFARHRRVLSGAARPLIDALRDRRCGRTGRPS